METRNIRVFGKNILSIYKHYIMSLSCEDVHETTTSLTMECVTNQPDKIIAGTYSIDTAKHIIKENTGKCEAFIFRNTSDEVVGTLSVMYKGGNELEYKIRNIDAFIYNVLTVEKFRGNGYASQMIHLVMNYLQGKSIPSTYLAVSTNNKSAIQAYEKAGFKKECSMSFIRILRVNIPYKVL